jgi:hypothetical protein
MMRREEDDAANAWLTAALEDLKAACESMHAPREAVLALLQEHRGRRRVVRPVRDALSTLVEQELQATHDFCQAIGRLG